MIYGFRGADGDFILNFEKYYKNAKIIKLEQNYRSTRNILNCANNLIRHNINRKGKHLWTEKEKGPDININEFKDVNDETKAICKDIKYRMLNEDLELN